MAKSTVEASTGVVIDLTEKAPIQVLLVDDETAFLKIAKECLEIEGPSKWKPPCLLKKPWRK